MPHIVFNPAVAEDAYFPGPAFWASERAPAGPDGVATSGLTQPPLHARAALEVAERTPDGDAARAFLARIFPRLAAQHGYLAGRRDAGGAGLAAIVHPWESGLDDSPAWDAPLAAVPLPEAGVAPYERRDREHVDPRERPSDAAYDRFVHLARLYRDGRYADDALAERCPFAVEDPLFNAIWLWSTHAMAEIAARLGEDPGRWREAAQGLHAALMSRLWDPGERRFLPREVAERPPLGAAHGALARAAARPGPARRRGRRGGRGARLPALPHAGRPRRRVVRPARAGVRPPPLLARADLGQPQLAARARPARARARPRRPAHWRRRRCRLVAGGGMHEYFDPLSGDGRGSGEFSWTAALLVDTLRRLTRPSAGALRSRFGRPGRSSPGNARRTQHRRRGHGRPAGAHRRRRQRPRQREHDGLQAPARRLPRPRLHAGGPLLRPGAATGAGAAAVDAGRAFAQGTLQRTDQPLDVAIQGEGFLRVRLADGTQALTRDGSLHLDGSRPPRDLHGRLRAARHHLPRRRRHRHDLDRPRRHHHRRRPRGRPPRRRLRPLAPAPALGRRQRLRRPRRSRAPRGPRRPPRSSPRARSSPPTSTWPRRWSR